MPHASPPSSFAPSAPPGTRRPKRHRPSRVCPACGLDTAAVRASYRPSLGGLFADCPRCQRPVLSHPPPPTIQRWRFGRNAYFDEIKAILFVILAMYLVPGLTVLLPSNLVWDGNMFPRLGNRTTLENIIINYSSTVTLLFVAGAFLVIFAPHVKRAHAAGLLAGGWALVWILKMATRASYDILGLSSSNVGIFVSYRPASWSEALIDWTICLAGLLAIHACGSSLLFRRRRRIATLRRKIERIRRRTRRHV